MYIICYNKKYHFKRETNMTKQKITVIKRQNDIFNEKEFDVLLKQQFGENYKDLFEIVIVNEEDAGIKWLKDIEPDDLKQLKEKYERLALKLNEKSNNKLLLELFDRFNNANIENRKRNKENFVLMKDRKGNSAFRKGRKSRSKY